MIRLALFSLAHHEKTYPTVRWCTETQFPASSMLNARKESKTGKSDRQERPAKPNRETSRGDQRERPAGAASSSDASVCCRSVQISVQENSNDRRSEKVQSYFELIRRKIEFRCVRSSWLTNDESEMKVTVKLVAIIFGFESEHCRKFRRTFRY